MGLYGIWKNKNIRNVWKYLYSGFIGFYCLFFFAIIVSAPKTTTASKKEAPSTTKVVEEVSYMTAPQLHYEYEQNEVSADQKYKDKWVYVTGLVTSIDKDFMGNIIVMLKTTNQFMGMHCHLDDEDYAARLQKGQQVWFKCKCEGTILGSVMMKDCKAQ